MLRRREHQLYIDDKIVGLLINQWLPCPLAILNLFGMTILINVWPPLAVIQVTYLHCLLSKRHCVVYMGIPSHSSSSACLLVGL